MRRAFNIAAQAVGPESQEAALLQKASTHWLRHTAGTALTLKGNELRAVAALPIQLITYWLSRRSLIDIKRTALNG